MARWVMVGRDIGARSLEDCVELWQSFVPEDDMSLYQVGRLVDVRDLDRPDYLLPLDDDYDE